MHGPEQTPFSNNTRDNFTHGHQQMVNTEIKLITFFIAKDGKAAYSKQKQDLELTVGLDHQLLIAKFRFKLNKTRKSTRPARYDLNQIPYEFTVEVTDRFKGLDLVNSAPKELWTGVHNIVQEVANKTIPQKREARRQSGYLRRPYK